MDFFFTLCLPREEVSVPAVRRLFGSSLRNVGVEEDCVSDIELVVTEACTNVLRHAQGTGEEYEVKLRVHNRFCEINVMDTGAGFDPEMAGHQEAVPSSETGRGIHLMRYLVDELHFVSGPGSGTVVNLVKELRLRDDSLLGRLSKLSKDTHKEELAALAEKSAALAAARSESG